MRKLALALVLGLAGGALAGGLSFGSLTPSLSFASCPAIGSDGGTLLEGSYLMSVTGEDVALCSAWTPCRTGGTTFPQGSLVVLTVGRGGQNYSCRSAGASGNVSFTPASY
jgi:hypothetical protein